jgi:nicotinamide mononucleotide transporter
VTPLEIAANAVTTLSIVLAARNHAHTWTTGVVGCLLFGVVFIENQLYADATLQVFFLVTSVMGWWQWRRPVQAAVADVAGAAERPITRAAPATIVWMALGAVAVTLAYGGLLHRFTDAYMPYVDAAVLGLSVVAQCLLMQRRLETWPTWLMVNTLSVPLFASRGLWLTAVLYAAYWFNAWYGWWRWHRERVQVVASAVAVTS